MSAFNSSVNGGSSGGGFSLSSGATTGTFASGGAGGIAAMSNWTGFAIVLFGVMAIFTCVMLHQAVTRHRRRRLGAR